LVQDGDRFLKIRITARSEMSSVTELEVGMLVMTDEKMEMDGKRLEMPTSTATPGEAILSLV
jgi:hypothetical protein